MILCSIVFTWAALAVLMFCEKRDLRTGIWTAKPLASVGFLVTAISAGATESLYGRLVLLALGLCWLGDVLLISTTQAGFLAGLFSFVAGHLAYMAAFTTAGVHPYALLGLCVGLCVPAAVVHRWLRPHLPDYMVWPTRAYIAVITCMVAAAGAAWATQPYAWRAPVGAVLFYLSDLCVARHRFVTPQWRNKLFGLPLYYVAQLLLACSV